MAVSDGDDVELTLTVLVVEDEVFLAMELEAALVEGGFRVLGPAGSVEDALYLLDDERPQVAVLDFNLGREKVIPVAVRLKALGVPFVLASASGQSELARYEVLADVANLGKPTDMVLMLDAVRELSA
jgi:DNA-binding response OmpR family regulator